MAQSVSRGSIEHLYRCGADVLDVLRARCDDSCESAGTDTYDLTICEYWGEDEDGAWRIHAHTDPRTWSSK
jgi:hypothetical protein